MNNTSNFTKEEKDKKVKAEVTRLKKIFKDLSQDKINTVNSLINNAAFMTVTLEDLQISINQNGTISEYKNGANQYGTKKSPEVEIYNTMIKNHMAIIKQLTDLLPNKISKKDEDGFDKFVNGRDEM